MRDTAPRSGKEMNMKTGNCFLKGLAMLLALLMPVSQPAAAGNDTVSLIRNAQSLLWDGVRHAVIDGCLYDLETGELLLTGIGQMINTGGALYAGGQGTLYLLGPHKQPVAIGACDDSETWDVSDSGWLVRCAGSRYDPSREMTVHDPLGMAESTIPIEWMCLARDYLTWTTADGDTWIRDLSSGKTTSLPYAHLLLEDDGTTVWATDSGDTPLYRIGEDVTEVIPAGYHLYSNCMGHYVEAGRACGYRQPGFDPQTAAVEKLSTLFGGKVFLGGSALEGMMINDFSHLVVLSCDTGEELISMDAKWVVTEPGQLLYSFRDEYAAVKDVNGEKYAVISLKTGETAAEFPYRVLERWDPGEPFYICLPDADDGSRQDICWIPETGEQWIRTTDADGKITYRNTETGFVTGAAPASDPILRELRGKYPSAHKTSDGFYLAKDPDDQGWLLFSPDGALMTEQRFSNWTTDFNSPIFCTGTGYAYQTMPTQRTVMYLPDAQHCCVITRDGAIILPGEFESIRRAWPGNGYTAKKDGQYYLYDEEGNLAW